MKQHFINNLWRWKCGLPEKPLQKNKQADTFSNLKKSEWDSKFEVLMRNRLILGALRYGKMKSANKPQYDRVSSMIKRLRNYSDSGNKEFLVDVANLCMLEFVECQHPNAHFSSVDDGEHVNEITK
jgi:hypothetical protein